tara:strand:+ start:12714 stop:13175 length:462 start_codon:yes stop_codon:yes gene_type:complete
LKIWSELNQAAPDIAVFGRERLDGKLAYLATIRSSVKPRIHPVTAIVSDRHCFIFAEPESTKVRDFSSNPRFSLHCAMSDSSGSSGEFQLMGQVVQIEDDSLRREAEANCTFRPSSRSILFELEIEEAIATSYRGGRPDRRRWRSNPAQIEQC